MPDSVDGAWRRITSWLDAHAPVTAAQIRGPADVTVVDAVERDVGIVLPADLRAWWSLTDGFDPHTTVSLIPDLHVPLPVATARDERRQLVEVSARFHPTDQRDDRDATAGGFSHRYQETFVPISTDHCGQVLFVDLRQGPWHGCVNEWDHEQGFLQPPLWRDVTTMLNDIADALWLGQPALAAYAEQCRSAGFTHDPRVWAEVNDDGELEWIER